MLGPSLCIQKKWEYPPWELQFILDASKIHEERYASLASDHLNDIEYQSRRLCYLLHGARQRTLNTVSLKKRF